MMRISKLFVLVLLAGFNVAFAQSNFTLSVGGALPLGDYAEGTGNSKTGVTKWELLGKSKGKGGAGMGVRLGLQEKIGIPSVDGLGITISVDAFFNGLNSDLKDFFSDMESSEDDYDDYYKAASDEEGSITKPYYLNIAPMLGVNYEYDISESFGLFAGMGLGANFRKITNYVVEYSYGDGVVESTMKYDLGISFAFKVGIGAVVMDKVVIGLDFFSLGSSQVKGKGAEVYDDEELGPRKFKYGKVNPKFFTFSLGFRF